MVRKDAEHTDAWIERILYPTKESGSGLGLHSAATFVIAVGGRIQPLSAGTGQGTTLRVPRCRWRRTDAGCIRLARGFRSRGPPADVLQNALLAPNCHAASGTPSSYFHKSLLKHLVTASVTAQNRAPRRILCSILQHFRKFSLALSYSLTPLLSMNCPFIGNLAQFLLIYWELPTPREPLGKDANELTNAKILIDDWYEPWLPFGGRDPTRVEPQSWRRTEAR